jgi:hypothetical protein
MVGRVTMLLAITLVGALVVPRAWAGETLSTQLSFDPNALGAPTNVLAVGTLQASAGETPPAVNKVSFYLPAGLELDLRGTGTCDAAALRRFGPNACPADSRVGFGGGTGSVELSKEVVHEPYTLDLFLGGRESGHVLILVYVLAVAPVLLELTLEAKEVPAPKPYGLGFAVEVPPISVLPAASSPTLESVFVTVGDDDVAYPERVHGKRELVHIRGVVEPRSCPRGGFPYEALIFFEGGSSLTSPGTAACPSG